MRVLLVLFLLALTGCVPLEPGTYVSPDRKTMISITPSRVEQRVTRDGYVKLVCPTVAMVYDIVDNNIVSPYCKPEVIRAPQVRSYYDSYQDGRVTIMETGFPARYWAEPGTIRDYRYSKKRKRYK